MPNIEFVLELFNLWNWSGRKGKCFLVLFELREFFNTIVKLFLDSSCFFKSLLGWSIGSNQGFTNGNLFDEFLNCSLLSNDFLTEVLDILLSLFCNIDFCLFDLLTNFL